MNLIILGPQGSGKGTQSEMLAKKFDWEHIDMGKYLREAAKLDTPVGKEIYHIQNVTKSLVPSRILKKVLHIKLADIPREKDIIFDGVPRTMGQAQYIEEAMLEAGRHIDKLVYINLPKEESIKRISKRWICKKCKTIFIMGKDIKDSKELCRKCGGEIIQRVDDTPGGIKKRLELFNGETVPMINHFREKGIVADINGKQTIREVFKEILKSLRTTN